MISIYIVIIFADRIFKSIKKSSFHSFFNSKSLYMKNFSLLIIVYLLAFGALNAQTSSFYACFVEDTIVLSLNSPTGSIQWQETTDTMGTWTNIATAVTNNYNYRITAMGTGFKYFRAKITNPAICSTGFYFSRIIKCRIVSNATQIQLGDIYAGGYVIYKNGYNGIVAAMNDQGQAAWGCSGVSVGASGTVVWTGQQNTADIVAGCVEMGIAAKVCNNLILAGYSDWYLPSIDELSSMYTLHTAGKGNFSTTTAYWSSSQNSATDARAFPFNTGNPYIASKSTSLKVRAIRYYYAMSVQQRLNAGETPMHIYNSGMPMDSLYGKTYAGGMIFYLNTTAGNGIVASPTNLGSHPVGNTATSYGCGAGGGIGDGPSNTSCLETTFTANGTAADTCVKYNYGGYTDWFLPSSGELQAMWSNLRVKNHGSWSNEYYWSSTNQDYNSGKVVSFITTYLYGQILGQSRTAGYPVRAARNFPAGTTQLFTQEPNVSIVNEITPTPPAITLDPVNKTVCPGSSALFRVTATGDQPLYFMWQKNGVDISGSNNDTLIIDPAGYADTASYRCIVYNGCNSDTSLAAKLSIPYVNAGADMAVCQNNSQASLSGTAISATDIIWSGGNGTYNPGANTLNPVYTPTAAELAAGTLTLTINTTGGGLCTMISDAMTVTFTPAPVANAGTDMNICESSLPIPLNGTVANAGGGVWSGGNGTFNPFNTTLTAAYNPSPAEINAGSVTLTLTTTGIGNCLAVTDNVTFVISKTPSANAGSDVVICNTAGSVQLSGSVLNASGGLWFGGSGGFAPGNTALNAVYTPSLQEITNGSVTLTLSSTGNGFCTAASDDVLITFGPNPVLSVITQNDPSCYGFCDGNAEISATGGTPPYQYLWPSAAGSLTTAAASSLCAGDYVVSVSDGAGCLSTITLNLYQPDLLTASVSSITNNECWGAAEGIVSTTVSGGTSPYTYTWSNGTTLANAYGLAAGTYAVTVVDNNSCYKIVNNIVVGQPAKIYISVSTTNAQCNQNDGTAMANVSGGTSPFTFLWSNNETTNPATGFEAGSHFVIVKDANGCNMTKFFPISNDGGFTLSAVTHDINCAGNNNGNINLTITGGSAPFNIEWSNGATTEDISGLSPGSYDVIVTDIVGCYGMESYIISDGDTVTSSSSTYMPTCNQSDGEITITTTGGTSPYFFNWSNAAGNVSQQAGLPAGNYRYTVTDASGCSATGLVPLTNMGAPVIVTDSVHAAPCGGLGGIYLSVSGGVGSLTYNWSDLSTSQDLLNVNPGAYQVTVTDQIGCQAIALIDVLTEFLPVQPICIVTVDTAFGRNLVVWERTALTGVSFYKVYRESSVPNQYQLIASVPSTDMTEYLDMAANPFVRSFRYKVSAVDYCGNETPRSDMHKTMHLTMNQGVGQSYNLIWDDYEGFNYTTVIVMRYLPSTGWVILDSLPRTLHSYTDAPPATNGIRYLVKIDAPGACEPTNSSKEVGGPYSSSFSNMEDEGLMVSAEGTDGSVIDFIAYPNPAKEFITVKSISSVEDFISIRIFNFTGQVVYNYTGSFNNEIRIDISGIAPGMYILQMEGNHTYKTRFVVE
jgi:hypothetical protein